MTDTKAKKHIRQAKLRLERQCKKLATDRDKLRELLDGYRDTLSDCDQAIASLENDVELLSQTV